MFQHVGERIRVTDGVPELVAGVQAAGGVVGVVSGGFHELLDPHRRAARPRPLAREPARWCGTGGSPARSTARSIDAAAKAQALLFWAAAAGVHLRQTVAIGDGANDLRMMAEAGLAVAFNAKPKVRAEADLVIDRPDLSQVLPLLGLRG